MEDRAISGSTKLTINGVILGVKISVEYSSGGHGRCNKVFLISDREGGKTKLSQKEAVQVARQILKIMKEGK